MTRFYISAFVIVLLALLSACQPNARPATGESDAPSETITNTSAAATVTPIPATDTPIPPTDTPVPPSPTPDERVEIGSSIEIRPVDEAESIESYRVQGTLTARAGEEIFQSITQNGQVQKEPRLESYSIVVTSEDELVTIDLRLVDGVRYVRFNEIWSETERFDLSELLIITPDQLVGTLSAFEFIGPETREGRNLLHLRIGQEELPIFQGGSETADFAEADEANLDLWIDADEQFIVQMTLAASQIEQGEPVEFLVQYFYTDFNQPVEVEAPDIAEEAQSGVGPTPVPSTVAQALGFDFPLPEGASFSVVAATVNVLTTLPLAEARAYAEDTMNAAGFEEISREERATDEFFYQYSDGERTVGMLVFQVSERGATIQLGAPK